MIKRRISKNLRAGHARIESNRKSSHDSSVSPGCTHLPLLSLSLNLALSLSLSLVLFFSLSLSLSPLLFYHDVFLSHLHDFIPPAALTLFPSPLYPFPYTQNVNKTFIPSSSHYSSLFYRLCKVVKNWSFPKL